MKAKLKQCNGAGGVPPHLAFIYKNINGLKYCKSCAYKLQAPKPIPKVRKGQEGAKNHLKNDSKKQMDLFLEIWKERAIMGRHFCEVSGEELFGKPYSYYFDHLLEKSKYPQYRYDKRNIIIVSFRIHEAKTNGHPHPIHQQFIDQFKQLIKDE